MGMGCDWRDIEECRIDAEDIVQFGKEQRAKGAKAEREWLADKLDGALTALLDYQQADEEGVVVITSRQAIHEIANALRAQGEEQ